MKRFLILVTIFSVGLVLWAGQMGHQMHQAKNPVFKHYVAAQEALAADNFEMAKNSLELLAKESEGELKTLTESALKAGDLKTLRKAFQPLSEAIAKEKLPNGLAVAYCPMVKKHWVQKNGKVANPYYGSAMLHCGTIEMMTGGNTHQHHQHH